MKWLDLTLPTPAENLALEEALLDGVEADVLEPLVRVWESDEVFVVLGAGSRIAEDVNAAACEADGVPVLRRCSGGGTVVQGPGCLNFTVVLFKESAPELNSIDGTNRYVLSRIARALETLDCKARMEGTSDLVCGGRKFSGNAQRRKKRAILFHGTLLYAFDLELVSRYLREPVKQPDYRQKRSHDMFVGNIAAERELLKQAIRQEWGAAETSALPDEDIVHRLVDEKYSQKHWVGLM